MGYQRRKKEWKDAMDTWLKREGKTPLFIFFRPSPSANRNLYFLFARVCVHGKRALPYLTHGLERHAYAIPPGSRISGSAK